MKRILCIWGTRPEAIKRAMVAPDILLCHGDTTTAMASSLAAFHRKWSAWIFGVISWSPLPERNEFST